MLLLANLVIVLAIVGQQVFNVVSQSNFSYEPDNINKVFTDKIKIRSYRTGTTYLVIKGADCGELRIPIYVTNVFQINLMGELMELLMRQHLLVQKVG